MPIVTGWTDHQENTVLIEYRGKWTWEEARQAVARATDMIAAKPYRCDIIANMRDGVMESVGPAIANGHKILSNLPRNTGLLVLITNPLVDMLVSAQKSFDPKVTENLRSASTMEQARGIIMQDRVARQ